MKKYKRIIFVFFVITVLSVAMVVACNAETLSGKLDRGIVWSFNDDGVLEFKGEGKLDYKYALMFLVPDYNDIKSVIIGEGITNIPDVAFENCNNIVSVSISDTVTEIGAYAFKSCDSLTSVTIPDSVSVIGTEAFAYCPLLADVSLGYGIVDIDENTFVGTVYYDDESNHDGGILYYSHILIDAYDVSYSDVTVREGTRVIGKFAFYNQRYIKSVKLPDSIVSIGDDAFRYSYLENINLPEGLKTIGNRAFDNSELKDITLPESLESIGLNAFHNCDEIVNIKIPDGITELPDSVFDDCVKLTNVLLPSSLEIIGNKAFFNCVNLTSINIPDTVRYIGDEAFYCCYPITELTLPEGVEYIGKAAFYKCLTAFDHVKLGKVKSIQAETFAMCQSLKSIIIPYTVTEIGEKAFINCRTLASVTIPESVKKIKDKAFYNCFELTVSCYDGSYSLEYIEKNNIPYVFISCEEHEFVSSRVVCKPDCTSDGTEVLICIYCGKEKEAVIPKLGCVNGKWKHTEPTYLKEGLSELFCERCGALLETIVIPVKDIPNYPDVKKGAWYEEAVEYTVRHRFILGNDRGYFEVNTKLTREGFVVILARVLDADLSSYVESSFSDVKKGSWYAPSVEWAYQHSIVNGIGGGKFGVGVTIDRESTAVLLYRLTIKRGIDTSRKADISVFSDYEFVSDWARDGVAWAVERSIIGSTSTNDMIIKPQMTLTKAQAAKMFMTYNEMK